MLRLARTGLHLLWGAATILLAYPWIDDRLRLALKRRWSRQLVNILGVRIELRGDGEIRGMAVANHISFLDIFVVNAVAPAAFVSKDDVRQWPLIGWLSHRTDTIFLARGSRSAAQQVRETLAETLRQGRVVAVFPEGTTTDGNHVLPFHGALFQAAIDAGAPVTPVVLHYKDRNGMRSPAPAYVGDTTLMECLWSIVTASGLSAVIEADTPLASAGHDRRQLAAQAHRHVAHRLTPSHPARPDAHREAGIPGDPQAAPPSGHRPTDSPSPVPADSLPA